MGLKGVCLAFPPKNTAHKYSHIMNSLKGKIADRAKKKRLRGGPPPRFKSSAGRTPWILKSRMQEKNASTPIPQNPSTPTRTFTSDSSSSTPLVRDRPFRFHSRARPGPCASKKKKKGPWPLRESLQARGGWRGGWQAGRQIFSR